LFVDKPQVHLLWILALISAAAAIGLAVFALIRGHVSAELGVIALVVAPGIALLLSNVDYTFDWIELHQRSASSGGTLEWRTRHEDTGHTGSVDIAFAILPDRLTFTTGFFVHQGNGQTDTSGAPADAVDFPDIEDTLWAPTASLWYRYDEHVSFIAGPVSSTTTRTTGSSTSSA
jgi:hypothetical protein